MEEPLQLDVLDQLTRDFGGREDPVAALLLGRRQIGSAHFLSDRLCGLPRALLGATTAEPVMAER